MRLQHLALEVRDQQRAIDLYARFFRFDPATARRYPDGVLILHDLTASRVAPADAGGEVPGSHTSGSRWIRATRSVGSGNGWSPNGIDLVEDEETEGYVGFKVSRPRPARSRGRLGAV